MKKYLMIIILFLSVFLISEEMKISTPMGNIKMSVSGNENTSANIVAKKVSVVEQIAEKLEIVEKKYCSKLNRLDQKRVKKIMNEVYDLLAMLPDDVYTNVKVIQKEQPAQVNTQTQSQNVNITIKTETTMPPVETKKIKEGTKSEAMSQSAFQSLYNSIKNEAFADDKLAVIKTAARRNKFIVSQLTALLDLFSFEDDKIKCVQIIYPKVIDKENAHEILNHFTYSSDKQKVEKIINR